MNFTLTTLGTASAVPVAGKNQSAQVLQVHGRLFLIDCGEGTQQRIRQAGLGFLKIEAVFISHIHGDHVFGLFGLLSTMGLYGRVAPLYVYGPAALGNHIRFFETWYGSELQYKIEFREIKGDGKVLIHTSKYVEVSAFPLDHKIETWGYRFDGIRGPKTPEGVHLPSYAYASDTKPFAALAEYVSGVDVLYHEATYTADLAQKALSRFHSTALEAARCAQQAGAGELILGHYSSRIRDIKVFESEARTVFPNTRAASDLDTFNV